MSILKASIGIFASSKKAVGGPLSGPRILEQYPPFVFPMSLSGGGTDSFFDLNDGDVPNVIGSGIPAIHLIGAAYQATYGGLSAGGDDAFLNLALNTTIFPAIDTGVLIGLDSPILLIEYSRIVSASATIIPTWEYSTGDDTWATLPDVLDNTSGFRFSNYVYLTPPFDWAPSSHLNGNPILPAYYVRIKRQKATGTITNPIERYFKVYDGSYTQRDPIGYTYDAALVPTNHTGGIASTISAANELRLLMLDHAADGSIHLHGGSATPDAVSFAAMPDPASDLATLVTLVTYQLTAYAAHDGDAKSTGGGSYHNRQYVGNDLISTTAPVTEEDCVADLNDLKIKWNAHDANDEGGFEMQVANLLGLGADVATWKIDESFGTRHGESADTALVPGSRSARLRINSTGVPALSHSASVEFFLPYAGTPYTVNSFSMVLPLRNDAPTGYTEWKDIVKITIADVTFDFYLRGPTPANGTTRVRISRPGSPDTLNPDTTGGHGYPYWWEPHIEVYSSGADLNDILNGYGNDWTGGSFSTPFSATVNSATAVKIKIERVLSDPDSGVPEMCGVVNTYIGPISLTLNYVP